MVSLNLTHGDIQQTPSQALQNTGATVHVITDSPAYVPINLRPKFYTDLEANAQRKLQQLMRRKIAENISYRTLIAQDDNAARFISDQARKSRVSMIVMGSHGRTGMERFILGSVAEKTVRYAQCPVLIVKR